LVRGGGRNIATLDAVGCLRKVIPIACAIVLAAGTGGAVVQKHRGLREYRRQVVGKRAIVGAAASAAYGQALNRPHEWGRGAGGYAKRFGSGLGTHAIKETIQMGVGKWLHENLHYQRSNLHGTWPRMEYAVRRTFIVPRTDKPGKTVAGGRIAGAFGSGLISRVWQPASTAGVGAGFASGGIALGADVGVNIAREFWPHKNHGR